MSRLVNYVLRFFGVEIKMRQSTKNVPRSFCSFVHGAAEACAEDQMMENERGSLSEFCSAEGETHGGRWLHELPQVVQKVGALDSPVRLEWPILDFMCTCVDSISRCSVLHLRPAKVVLNEARVVSVVRVGVGACVGVRVRVQCVDPFGVSEVACWCVSCLRGEMENDDERVE